MSKQDRTDACGNPAKDQAACAEGRAADALRYDCSIKHWIPTCACCKYGWEQRAHASEADHLACAQTCLIIRYAENECPKNEMECGWMKGVSAGYMMAMYDAAEDPEKPSAFEWGDEIGRDPFLRREVELALERLIHISEAIMAKKRAGVADDGRAD